MSGVGCVCVECVVVCVVVSSVSCRNQTLSSMNWSPFASNELKCVRYSSISSFVNMSAAALAMAVNYWLIRYYGF